MKKGINIWSFPEGTIRECLTLAKAAGFEGVELALSAEGELSMHSTEGEIREVRAVAEGLGLSLYSLSSGLCWDLRLSDDDPAKRSAAKDMIKMAVDAFTGRDRELAEEVIAGDDVVDDDSILLSLAVKAGVRLLIQFKAPC